MRTNELLNTFLKKRIYVFLFIILAVFFVLLTRISYLQLVLGKSFYEDSQLVIHQTVNIPASRGEVYDRNYIMARKYPLISNKIRKTLIAIPAHFEVGELFICVEQLELLFELEYGTLLRKIEKSSTHSYKKIELILNMTNGQVERFADYYLLFSKFILHKEIWRFYNEQSNVAHVTGYIGLPSAKDIQQGAQGDVLVGKNGLELIYNETLSGEDGEILQLKIQNDSSGQVQLKSVKSGKSLILTIDILLQRAVVKAMQNYQGAVVVLRPKTGEILSLVSTPSYNPNLLLTRNKKKRGEHLRYMNKVEAELNRAIATKFPPASSFKTLVALAALEEGLIDFNKKSVCKGKFILKSQYSGFDDAVFYDWDVHGAMTLKNAIAYSCSSYFYNLGYQIGSEVIIKYARYFHLDQKMGIDLPGEITGVIPSNLWKEKVIGQRWYDGDTINLSIGQGFLETTLLSMTNFYSAIINNGVAYKPHLVKEIYRMGTSDIFLDTIKKEVLYAIPLEKKNLNFIKEALMKTVTDGTAKWPFRRYALKNIAGKTGTVQTKSNNRLDNESQHAWFIGFGPTDKEKFYNIVVGIFIEWGRAGSVPASIAAQIFQHWDIRLKEKSVYLD